MIVAPVDFSNDYALLEILVLRGRDPHCFLGLASSHLIVAVYNLALHIDPFCVPFGTMLYVLESPVCRTASKLCCARSVKQPAVSDCPTVTLTLNQLEFQTTDKEQLHATSFPLGHNITGARSKSDKTARLRHKDQVEPFSDSDRTMFPE